MEEIFRKLGVNINVSFHLLFFSLVWARVLAMTSFVPFLFGKPAPRTVVTGASMALAAFIYPHIVPKTPPPITDDILFIVILYVKEVFYGLSIGLVAGVLFHAFAAVGQMVDNQRGVSIARALIPQLGEQGSITGAFLFQLGLVIYLTIGGHNQFLAAFFEGFKILPVLEFPATGPGFFPFVDLFIRITGELLMISVQLAMPVIIAIFISDIILGIANRIAPQINVWELGFNVKGYLGVLMLAVSITMVGEQMQAYTLKSNYYAAETIRLLHGEVPPGVPTSPKEPEPGMQQPEEGAPEVKTIP